MTQPARGTWPIFDLIVMRDFGNPQSVNPAEPVQKSSFVRIHMDVPILETDRGDMEKYLEAQDFDHAYVLATKVVPAGNARDGALAVLKAAFKQ
jgi:hypothetical protein